MASLTQGLNAEQKKAVLHDTGPLLVLAGAGSGKTSTMTVRIAHLISSKNISPRNILGLSFTNKASSELKERALKLIKNSVSQEQSSQLMISTFHSLCVKILRQYADRLGYHKNFSIVDAGDQIDLIRKALKTYKINDKKLDPAVVQYHIGQSKNRFLSPQNCSQYVDRTLEYRHSSDYSHFVTDIYQRYQNDLSSLNAMDFDDLLFNTVRLLSEHQDVRDKLNERFQYILVDEYQDTNPSQFKLLRYLTEKQQNLCVVGDDDQSIYAWRGADPTHILDFKKHYPEANTITLNQNYRSTNTILKAANHVIQKNSKRHPKTLWSQNGDGKPITKIVLKQGFEEAEAVASEIELLATDFAEGRRIKTRPWNDFAILYRSNTQVRAFEEILRSRQIPYKIVGGQSFLERKETKDVLAYWRTVINSRDELATRRALLWPTRGIGKTSIDSISQYASQNSVNFFEACLKTPNLVSRAKIPLDEFTKSVLFLKQSLASCPATVEALSLWAKQSLDVIGVKTGLDQDSDNAAQYAKKWENVEELASGISNMQFRNGGQPKTAKGLLAEYITRMTLEPSSEKEKPTDELTLMTLHGSKGLEFPVVFLVGLEEGTLPHRRVLEEATDLSEERRLFYVGITRAKSRLYLTRSKTRVRYGKTIEREPCRFLADIPRDLLDIQDDQAPQNRSDSEHEVRVSRFLDQIKSSLSSSSSESV